MMDRRRFLEMLGIAGAATALGPRAWAQETAPTRLLVVSHCHGWPYASWRLRPDGLGDSTPWDLDLASLAEDAWSQPLSPLYAHRARLLAVDGLSLASAELDVDGNRHDTGWVHAWTGNRADFGGTDTQATSASLDQLLAERVARVDRLPSLELSVDGSNEPGRPISYDRSGARLPVENDPGRVWQRLFGPSRAPDDLAPRRKDLVDYAWAEYQALAPQLGRASQAKLDAHFELLSRLGDRLEGMATLSCGSAPQQTGRAPTYDENFDAMAELVGAAFACDVTRVVTLSLGEMPTQDFGWDHLTDDVHKGLAHGIYDDAEKHQAMTDYLTRHAAQVARLVSVLEGLPDVDGRSVMDNTLIAWGSELADGWHGYEHYCPLIIGGGWHFRGGRYLFRPQETPVQMLSRDGYTQTSGLPHQRWLVSVAEAMGLDVDRVGQRRLKSQTGAHIDCTGPLPDLT